MMLEGRWDAQSVAWIAEGIENYSDSVQTWTLSAMYERPSIGFIPKLGLVQDSDDVSVRKWAASVAERISWLLPTTPPEDTSEGVRTDTSASDVPVAEAAATPSPGSEPVTLADAWLATEKDSGTRRYLTTVATRLAAYRVKAAP